MAQETSKASGTEYDVLGSIDDGPRSGWEPKYPVQCLIDAAAVLGAFGPRNTPLSLREISAAVQIGRSKVHRLLDTLRFLGFIDQDEVTRKYYLGMRAFELAAAAASRFDLGPAARQALQELVSATGETVIIGVLRDEEVVFVDNIHGFGPLRLEMEVGTRCPATCCALGKAILAFEAPERVERILSKPLHALTPKSITDPDRLREDLVEIRSRGYAIDDEESFVGARCISMPVMGYNRLPVAAIAIEAPIARFPLTRAQELVKPLSDVVRRISPIRNI